MLDSTWAQIGFFIWVILQAVMLIVAFKVANGLGKFSCIVSAVITGTLLFTQNWTVFFWFVLIGTAIVPLLPLIKMERRQKLTLPAYLFTLGFTYLLCYGTYGILHVLNG